MMSDERHCFSLLRFYTSCTCTSTLYPSNYCVLLILLEEEKLQYLPDLNVIYINIT